MNLQECLILLKNQIIFEETSEKEEGKILYTYEGHICKFYQLNHTLYWECSLGPKLENTPQISQKLSQLLQFNLKRMTFLDETLFFDSKTQHLYLRKQINSKNLYSENLATLWEDFILNTETIKDRFFPSQE